MTTGHIEQTANQSYDDWRGVNRFLASATSDTTQIARHQDSVYRLEIYDGAEFPRCETVAVTDFGFEAVYFFDYQNGRVIYSTSEMGDDESPQEDEIQAFLKANGGE